MKSTKVLFLALLCLVFFTACDDEFFGVRGEGPVVTEYRPLHTFDAIDVEVDATVFFTQGQQEDMRIEAQENILRNLETYVQGNTLKIKFDKNVRKHSHIRIYLSAPTLKGITLDGSGSFKADNTLVSEFLSVNVSGSGDVELGVESDDLHTAISGSGHVNYSGLAAKQSITISGSGEVKAFDLESQQANVHLSGSGDADLWVKERLDVQISGSGNVTYKGEPDTVNSHISGSGKVRAY